MTDKKPEKVTTEIRNLVTERKRLKELIIKKSKQLQHDEDAKIITRLCNELHNAYVKIEHMEEEFDELFDRSFKNVSSTTIFTPIKLRNDPYTEYPISLTKKGFATYRQDSWREKKRSYEIKEYREKRNILQCYELADYIKNHDKRDMFQAFHDEMSNWVDPQNQTVFSINNDIIRLTFSRDYESDDEEIADIDEECYKQIKLELRASDSPTLQYFEKTKSDERCDEEVTLNNLTAGDIVLLCEILKDEHRESIEEAIQSLDSIAKNNELVLSKIRRKIARYIVAEAL
jgi:hypothetical protein